MTIVMHRNEARLPLQSVKELDVSYHITELKIMPSHSGREIYRKGKLIGTVHHQMIWSTNLEHRDVTMRGLGPESSDDQVIIAYDKAHRKHWQLSQYLKIDAMGTKGCL